MDDFGSGYSSLNVLKDIHVDVLKFDVDFLVNKNDSDRGGLILSSVIRMAKWLNLHTVMEGVETREQVTFLKSIGCEEAQGFLFAKPMTASELEDILKNQDAIPVNYTEISTEDIKDLWDPDSKLSVLFNNMLTPAGIYEIHDNFIEALRLNDQYCASIDLCRDSTKGCTYNVIDLILEEDRDLLWDILNRAKINDVICEGVIRRYVNSDEIKTFNMKVKHITGNETSSMFFVVLNEVIYDESFQHL
ncbi:hypothetical protein SDC9_172036 [bioreactor metagenome]|uniref:EAL domain-containing protein n=1 Tax=bioreactor metagenome TaxID=1076179 RepID=A0A645GD79_9ZZZZ